MRRPEISVIKEENPVGSPAHDCLSRRIAEAKVPHNIDRGLVPKVVFYVLHFVYSVIGVLCSCEEHSGKRRHLGDSIKRYIFH